jgi:transposase-like protein
VLGFEVGDTEDGAFWTSFARSLKTRGLTGLPSGSSGCVDFRPRFSTALLDELTVVAETS